MKYLVQIYNDGNLTQENVESELGKQELAEQYYNELLTCYTNNGLEPNIDVYTDESEPGSYSIEAEIDYCMGDEYTYDILVKVEEIR